MGCISSYGIDSNRTTISDKGIWELLQDIGHVKAPVESAAAAASSASAALVPGSVVPAAAVVGYGAGAGAGAGAGR